MSYVSASNILKSAVSPDCYQPDPRSRATDTTNTRLLAPERIPVLAYRAAHGTLGADVPPLLDGSTTPAPALVLGLSLDSEFVSFAHFNPLFLQSPDTRTFVVYPILKPSVLLALSLKLRLKRWGEDIKAISLDVVSESIRPCGRQETQRQMSAPPPLQLKILTKGRLIESAPT
ncbi:MAG: hypothetical protein HZA95_01105 [Candidatus Vogelbacteria bacterium]|nr:hypothetical protein [Candidatus Vogelbacteria bacterium]